MFLSIYLLYDEDHCHNWLFFNVSLNFSAFTLSFYCNSRVHTFTGKGQKQILFYKSGPIKHNKTKWNIQLGGHL